MKVLFSQLQKYLPDLTNNVKEVSDVYTMIGYMLDGPAEEVEYNGKKDFMLDLEVRQNRADGFGVIGLAKELSAYYNIPLKLPEAYSENSDLNNKSEKKLPIDVKAKNAVKRLMAVKLKGVNVNESPKWLKDYLELYEINSINNIVDLTNYIMLETAHASHAFDVDLVGSEKLIWEIDPKKYKRMTTLSGEEVELNNETLVISDGKRPLSLSIIGGKEVAINSDTTDIILEMAIYDGGLVRRNSRNLKILTEASQRLEKFLDPDSIPLAFNWLVKEILDIAGGEVDSAVFDNYLQKTEDIKLEVDLDKVQQIAGIEIAYNESKTYLKRLGFEIIKDNKQKILVKRPLDRLDIEQEEDVFEEIIRLKGFYNIPIKPVTISSSEDVTPSHLKTIDKIKEVLINNGFDEVRSWVLVDEQKNKESYSGLMQPINVQNSINEEVPTLRQSITISLINQLEELHKQNVEHINIFEIGKVFSKKGSAYDEYYSLGMLIKGNDLNMLRLYLETIFRSFGLVNILYKSQKESPTVGHPKTYFDVVVNNKVLGVLFVTNKTKVNEACIAEINISLLDKIISENINIQSSKEITQKIVYLDTNVVLLGEEDINSYIQNLINNSDVSIWSWNVVDDFKTDDDEKVKYTVRVGYEGYTDPEAKELHKKLFGE